MASINSPFKAPTLYTHGGGRAVAVSPADELRRTVLACLLWEDTFYEKGSAIATRIETLSAQVDPPVVAALAVEARTQMHLRHVGLFLVRQLARRKGCGNLVAETLATIIQRPDELTEYLAMYWPGKAVGTTKRPEPLSAGSKRGLAKAFQKFGAYALAKYDKDGGVRLRDVLRLTHGKPKDREQAEARGKLIQGTLESPDTWEVALSAGKAKGETFERLLREEKLGGLAFLRNLRNMIEAKVPDAQIRQRFAGNFDKVLPFRFVAAAKYAPRFADDLDQAMLRAMAGLPKLAGETALILDVSGSMNSPMSVKSDMDRIDAAAALAVLIRERCEVAHVYATAGSDSMQRHKTEEVAARRGMALVDGVRQKAHTLGGGGIFLVQAMQAVRKSIGHDVDRVIVFTDEQDTDRKLKPTAVQTFAPWNYLINVASYQHGVGASEKWTATISGFSERIFDYLLAVEAPTQ